MASRWTAADTTSAIERVKTSRAIPSRRSRRRWGVQETAFEVHPQLRHRAPGSRALQDPHVNRCTSLTPSREPTSAGERSQPSTLNRGVSRQGSLQKGACSQAATWSTREGQDPRSERPRQRSSRSRSTTTHVSRRSLVCRQAVDAWLALASSDPMRTDSQSLTPS